MTYNFIFLAHAGHKEARSTFYDGVGVVTGSILFYGTFYDHSATAKGGQAIDCRRILSWLRGLCVQQHILSKPICMGRNTGAIIWAANEGLSLVWRHSCLEISNEPLSPNELKLVCLKLDGWVV